MIIKVDGLREPENIRDVCNAGADWIGFVFDKESPRFVKQVSSRGGFIPDYTSIEDELPRLGPPVKRNPNKVNHPKRLGAFIDEMPQTIVTRIFNFWLDFVQLDGDENRVMIENLRRTVEPDIRSGVKVVKRLAVATAADFERCKEYVGAVDYFLFDVEEGNRQVLEAYQLDVPFLLGKIEPADAAWLKTYSHPQFAGVSLDEAFETEPGVKDIAALTAFIQEVKA